MSIEQAYVESVKPVVAGTFAGQLALALVQAKDDEARLARRRQLALARERLRSAPRSLVAAVARLDDVALDTAWRAALRGDSAVLEARVLPTVRAAAPRPRKGSPWRAPGWLGRRAGGR